MTDIRKQTAGIAISSLVLGILGLVCLGPLAAIPAVICGHIAKTKIKASAGSLEGEGLALAGLILGYVSIGLMVVFLPLYAGIAIPSFVKARDVSQRNACINNMRMIDSAKKSVTADLNYTPGDPIQEQEISKYLKNGFSGLICPKGGSYSINPDGQDPACSVHGTLSEATSRKRMIPALVQPNEPYATPTQEQKRWALATCAILTESNKSRHDLLGGCERTQDEIQSCQETLNRWWGVRSRADLLETLKWIDEGGHRQEFDKIARNLSAATPAQLANIRKRVADNPSESNRVEIVLKYKDDFGRKSIIAWDYDRYVSLCGWGYIAGYLSEEEAWQKIMPVARLLQKTFDSWKDLGENHVVGRQFWSWKQNQTLTRRSYEKLLADPSSPWVQLKWDMDLSPPKTSEIKTQNPH